MKRSWLIGAALLLSLSAVACSDDSDDTAVNPDGSIAHNDAGPAVHVDGGLDGGGGGLDGGPGLDATVPVHDAGGDAGDAH